jgi:hypothetical protein
VKRAVGLCEKGIDKKTMSMHISVGGKFFDTALTAVKGDSCERVKQVPIVVRLLDCERFSHLSSSSSMPLYALAGGLCLHFKNSVNKGKGTHTCVHVTRGCQW